MLEAGEEPKKLDIVEVDIKFVLCCYAESESYYKEGLNYYGLTVNDAHFLELDVSKTRGMLAASLVCSVILMIGAIM